MSPLCSRHSHNDPKSPTRFPEEPMFWEVGVFTNLRLLGVVVVSILMQLGIHYIPAAQAVFDVGPLSAADCALTLLVALGPVTVIETSKLARRWNARKTAS